MNGKEKIRNAICYILFLVIGTILFFAAALQLKVPVYETVDGKITENSREILLEDKVDFMKDHPVFVYKSREETLEKIETYEVTGKGIVPSGKSSFAGGEKIKVDVQTEEVSLLKLIFLKGGNERSFS